MHAFAVDGNFDFHLAGVHLKAYMGNDDPGTEQRRLSAERLVSWSNRKPRTKTSLFSATSTKNLVLMSGTSFVRKKRPDAFASRPGTKKKKEVTGTRENAPELI